MYRTTDLYQINFQQTFDENKKKKFSELIKEYDLTYFLGSIIEEVENTVVKEDGNEDDGEDFEIDSASSYAEDKKLIWVLHKSFGSFSLEADFQDEFYPRGCFHGTDVKFEVNNEGDFTYILGNYLGYADNEDISEECREWMNGKEFDKTGYIKTNEGPIDDDYSVKGNMKRLSMQAFLNLFEH